MVLAHLSPVRRRLVLSLAGGLAVLLLVLGVVVVTRAAGGDDVVAVAQGTPGPVLLVPGYGGSTSSLDDLAAALRRDGRDVTVVPLLGDGTGDLVAQSEALDRAAHAVLDRTAAPSVDVVGYSAGGVIVRLWAADLDGASLARRVVTLSSPHHGTDLAGLAGGLAPDACPEACEQLVPDSDLLTGLDRGDETPDGPLWTAIWTDDDRTVVPPTSGSLAGAVDFSVQQVCPGLVASHGDMPHLPAVIAMVASELGTAAPAVPTSRVC